MAGVQTIAALLAGHDAQTIVLDIGAQTNGEAHPDTRCSATAQGHTDQNPLDQFINPALVRKGV